MWGRRVCLAALKTGKSIFTSAHLLYVRQIRSAMMRGLSGETLASALDGFERGDLRQAAQYWQTMAARDDDISIVKPKREKSVSRRDWQVLTSDDSGEAKRQKAVLTDFWNRVKAVNAFDLNDRGGFSKLVRQMMESVSFKYAAHHLVWRPSRDRLDCAFESVPLQFFENRSGRLGFCPTGMEFTGNSLEDEEWMVTVGDGLMQAGSIGYFCKRNALADWLAFSDKFGMPGLLGKTKHGKGTTGGNAMEEAVATFGQDWAGVIFGDDGSGTIDLVQAAGGTSTLPMPDLVERVGRRLTALWRGADLGTTSSKDATGASLQQGETDLIEQDDALTISEKLNEIEEIVLRWHFGSKVNIKAYIKLIVPQSEDLKLLIEAVTMLVRLGAPIAVDDVLERFAFGQPKAGAVLLGERVPGSKSQVPSPADDQARINAADAAEEKFLAGAARLLAKARAEDRQDLVGEIKVVLNTPDGTRLNALAAFVEKLPEKIGQDAAQVAAWETLLSSALVNGWALKPEA